MRIGRNKLYFFVFLLFSVAILAFISIDEMDPFRENNVQFSVESGFYDAPFKLKLLAPGGMDIYYTVDGSEPTTDSIKYEEPIEIGNATLGRNRYAEYTEISAGYYDDLIEKYSDNESYGYKVPDYNIDKCTIIRARSYDKSGGASSVYSASYFVGLNNDPAYKDINVISIMTDPDNLFDYDTGIYVLGKTFEDYMNSDEWEEHEIGRAKNWNLWRANFRNEGPEWQRDALIQVFDKDRNIILNQDCGIRIKGDGSRGLVPRSFNIFSTENDFNVDLLEGGQDLSSFTISSGGQDNVTLIRDYLVTKLTSDRDYSTTEFYPCALFLEGEYWGMYHLTEKYNKQYFKNRYDVDEEDILMVKVRDVDIGSKEAYYLFEKMQDYIIYCSFKKPEQYEKACGMVDMQSLIDYYSTSIYIARWGDWPASNMAYWRTMHYGYSPYADGKWRFLMYDANTHSFEADCADRNIMAEVVDQDMFFGGLCRSKQFRQDFAISFMDIANNNFYKENYDAVLNKYKEKMMNPLMASAKRFYGEDKEEYIDSDIEGIRYFLDNRKLNAAKHVADQFGLSGDLANVNVFMKDVKAGHIKVNNTEMDFSRNINWEGQYFVEYPITLNATAREGYVFKGWTGSIESEEETITVDFNELGNDIQLIPVYERKPK